MFNMDDERPEIPQLPIADSFAKRINEELIRTDERAKTLDQVEQILFDHYVGQLGNELLIEEPPEAEVNRRVTVGMQRFMVLSDWFKVIFKDAWPNK